MYVNENSYNSIARLSVIYYGRLKPFNPCNPFYYVTTGIYYIYSTEERIEA